MNRTVFVSHSGEDSWIAKQIARGISECGAEPFLDQDVIEVGSDFEEDILEGLRTSDEFVALMSPWSINRRYLWVELGVAWERKLRIVVALQGLSREDFLDRPNMPIFLMSRNIIALNDIDKYFDQLSRRVAGEGADDRKS